MVRQVSPGDGSPRKGLRCRSLGGGGGRWRGLTMRLLLLLLLVPLLVRCLNLAPTPPDARDVIHSPRHPQSCLTACLPACLPD